jgi:hypothetical protein
MDPVARLLREKLLLRGRLRLALRPYLRPRRTARILVPIHRAR